MKFRLSSLIIIYSVLTLTFANAEYYKVNVKRIDQDLYKSTTNGLYIQTRFCFEFTFGDDAILKYDQFDTYNNKLIFDSGEACEIVKIFN